MAYNTTSNSYSPPAPNVANSYCITASSSSYDDEKMIDAAVGLRPSYYRMLNSVLPHENVMTIAKYIASMKTEVNLSDHYRQDLIAVLYKLIIFLKILMIYPFLILHPIHKNQLGFANIVEPLSDLNALRRSKFAIQIAYSIGS
jgi:hypothetical protein